MVTRQQKKFEQKVKNPIKPQGTKTPKVKKPFTPIYPFKKSKGKKETKKTGKSNLFQQTKYTPSFTALGLGIKGKKPKGIFGESYMPTIRPILKI